MVKQEEYREWMALMKEARQLGLSPEEVRDFLDNPRVPELLSEGTGGYEG
ncbi:anti-repressor SinI family protein [Halobacillus kuroshimensis]|uniref:Anti-repressor SinI family protein n=1 Tax=Halobacillus kuroshimensis TaxID=302481 RepID=A0ABS3DUU0_9BACI|nr:MULTISPECIES: anti-repressor SinI family protein [Halobacillus]MBN8235113.1 anti-repressor SinI family protein [Halobacillus kuroshimensis]